MRQPICARCCKPVDRFVEKHDPFTETIRFTVYCHGETESVAFNECELIGANAVMFREAFLAMIALPQ